MSTTDEYSESNSIKGPIAAGTGSESSTWI